MLISLFRCLKSRPASWEMAHAYQMERIGWPDDKRRAALGAAHREGHSGQSPVVCFCLFHLFRKLRFQGIEVETRAMLHWRIVNGCLGQLGHLLLDEDESPEFRIETSSCNSATRF